MTCFLYSSLYLAVRQDCLPFHPYRSRCWRFRYGCSRRGWLHRRFVSGRGCWRRRCCRRHGSFLDRRLHAACRNRFGHKRSRIHRVLTRFIPCRRILDDGLDGRSSCPVRRKAYQPPSARKKAVTMAPARSQFLLTGWCLRKFFISASASIRLSSPLISDSSSNEASAFSSQDRTARTR